jgi:hypothetical protein
LKIFTAIAAAAFAISATAASATTVYYSTYLSGDDLGSGTMAVLTADQVGNDVEFSLLAVIDGALTTASSFIGAIGFTYNGLSQPTVVEKDDGSEVDKIVLGEQSLGNFDITFGAQFGQGQDRLLKGETALFTIKDVQLALFDFSDFKTGIHIQATTGREGSSKYNGGECIEGSFDCPEDIVVPLPGALPLLAGGLIGAGAFLRRKSRKTA